MRTLLSRAPLNVSESSSEDPDFESDFNIPLTTTAPVVNRQEKQEHPDSTRPTSVAMPEWIQLLNSNSASGPYNDVLDRVPTLRRKSIHIGFLGTNTSSEAAARTLLSQLGVPKTKKANLVNRASFAELLMSVEQPRSVMKEIGFPAVDLAIVPAASKDINDFFMSRELFPAIAFFHPTPVYGLAYREGVASQGNRIAHFPVTHPVLKALLKESNLNDFSLVNAKSTADAAALVVAGDADYAVTNDEARDAFNLRWHTLFGVIPMIWVAFQRRSAVV